MENFDIFAGITLVLFILTICLQEIYETHILAQYWT